MNAWEYRLVDRSMESQQPWKILLSTCLGKLVSELQIVLGGSWKEYKSSIHSLEYNAINDMIKDLD